MVYLVLRIEYGVLWDLAFNTVIHTRSNFPFLFSHIEL
jgi:hypothetical protein